jgi:hypothetical protein
VAEQHAATTTTTRGLLLLSQPSTTPLLAGFQGAAATAKRFFPFQSLFSHGKGEVEVTPAAAISFCSWNNHFPGSN